MIDQMEEALISIRFGWGQVIGQNFRMMASFMLSKDTQCSDIGGKE